jgi:hypothetical protein
MLPADLETDAMRASRFAPSSVEADAPFFLLLDGGLCNHIPEPCWNDLLSLFQHSTEISTIARVL